MSSARLSNARPAIGPILLGGVIAASIDIGSACLITQRGVGFILHVIAGGLLAERAFAGGLATAALGLVLQEGMGVMIAAVYAFGATIVPSLARRWVACGLLYGVAIFAVMNYVIVPLSAWHRVPRFSAITFAANLAAMLLFGLIVAYFVGQRRAWSAQTTSNSARRPKS